jgi:hypothetical protein
MAERDSIGASRREQTLDVIEARARKIGGGIHVHGAIPARCWRQAIAERFLGEPVRDPEWAERMVADRDYKGAVSSGRRATPEDTHPHKGTG